jgi:hypothetical protein
MLSKANYGALAQAALKFKTSKHYDFVDSTQVLELVFDPSITHASQPDALEWGGYFDKLNQAMAEPDKSPIPEARPAICSTREAKLILVA